MKPIDAVLFDLDGTLLDTAQDLTRALNNVLQKYNKPLLPIENVRSSAGFGYKGLLKLAGLKKSLGKEILAEYEKHLLDSTALFPGMEDVLLYLENQQIPWGIVTNKPEKFTQPIVDGLYLAKRAVCIISGDTLENCKPHPEPILHACKLMQRQPQHCLFIGDAKVDILASNAAGVLSLVALYGYIPEEEDPQKWGATGMIQHPSEILPWIKTSRTC